MGKMTQPAFGGKSAGNADNGKKSASNAKDKSGFGGSKVDPGLRTPFTDAVYKK